MSGSKVTPGQLACIHAMVNKLKLQSSKAEMIMGATAGRTESSKDLTLEEAKTLIQWLKSRDPEEIKAEVMRKKIISYAHELNWRIPGTAKVDMALLDRWMVKYSYLGKKLNQYRYAELPALISQMEKVYSKELAKWIKAT